MKGGSHRLSEFYNKCTQSAQINIRSLLMHALERTQALKNLVLPSLSFSHLVFPCFEEIFKNHSPNLHYIIL